MTGIKNSRNKKRFTELLQELVCQKACDLQNALLLISRTKSKKQTLVELSAQNLYDSLRHGEPFSLAIKNCPYIKFDELYVSFIGFAERCGELESTLEFLKQKCLREEPNTQKVIEASVYPVFVVLVSVAAATGLVFYSNAFLQEHGASPVDWQI